MALKIKPGSEVSAPAGKNPSILCIRRSLVTQRRKLQQQLGLLVVRLRENLQKVGLQVVVGRGARGSNQPPSVGHPHGDLLRQGLHQVGIHRCLCAHGLNHELLFGSDEPNGSIIRPKVGKLDLHRHLVLVVGRGLLVGDQLVVGTCHLRNFGRWRGLDAKLAALLYAPSLAMKEKGADYLDF